jgi:hypothetical protein
MIPIRIINKLITKHLNRLQPRVFCSQREREGEREREFIRNDTPCPGYYNYSTLV